MALAVWRPALLGEADLRSTTRWSAPSRRTDAGTRAVVVAIDEASLARAGQWPWSRAVLASAGRSAARARRVGDRVRPAVRRSRSRGRGRRSRAGGRPEPRPASPSTRSCSIAARPTRCTQASAGARRAPARRRAATRRPARRRGAICPLPIWSTPRRFRIHQRHAGPRRPAAARAAAGAVGRPGLPVAGAGGGAARAWRRTARARRPKRRLDDADRGRHARWRSTRRAGCWSALPARARRVRRSGGGRAGRTRRRRPGPRPHRLRRRDRPGPSRCRDHRRRPSPARCRPAPGRRRHPAGRRRLRTTRVRGARSRFAASAWLRPGDGRARRAHRVCWSRRWAAGRRGRAWSACGGCSRRRPVGLAVLAVAAWSVTFAVEGSSPWCASGAAPIASARRRGDAQRLIVQALTTLTETRDADTGRHARRTQEYTRILATALARLAAYRTAQLTRAASPSSPRWRRFTTSARSASPTRCCASPARSPRRRSTRCGATPISATTACSGPSRWPASTTTR